ncbi:MAG TPA: thioesterase domain-containing protein [Arenibaculum sp.]|nr:thioesterase domain-containing protein [Arenibaculum sp.]
MRKVEGAREAMLCIHPGGLPSKVYARLAEALPDVSLYVAELSISMPYVQASEPGAEHRGGVERVARSVLDDFGAIAQEPVGILCGWSFGGVIAHRLAQEIVASGGRQPMVILLDTIAPAQAGPLDRFLPFSAKSLAAGAREKPVLMRWFVSYLNALRGCRISITGNEIARLSDEELLERLLDRLKSAGGMGQDVTIAGFGKVFREFRRGMNRNTSLLAQYVPGGGEIDVVLIRASKPLYRIFHVFRRMGWGRLARSVDARTVRGDHYQLIADPDCIQAITNELRALRGGR